MSPKHETVSDLEEQKQTQNREPNGSQVDRKPLTITSTSLLTHGSQKSFTKRLWQWTGFGENNLLDLISTAAAVAIPIIGIIISHQQDELKIQQEVLNAKNEQRQLEIAYDSQRHQILSKYLELMTGFLLQNKLDNSADSTETRFIARARTLNTLTQLDGDRKGQLLKFLYEAHLIGGQCQADLVKFKFSQCHDSVLDLQDAKFDKTTFEHPIPLQGIDLTSASLSGAELVGIDLTNARMKGVRLENANLTQAALTKASMELARLDGAKLVDAISRGVDLTSALLRKADLSGANLEEAVLKDADLQGAVLNNANLKKADLRNTDLTDASLQGASLNGAIYNGKTRFPKGFNREGKGMQRQP